MRALSLVKDRKRRSFGSWLTKKSRQEYREGQWQQESPAKECLEQVKCCHDTDCNEPMMKKCFSALKNGTKKKLQEKDESLRMGLRQDKMRRSVMLRSTDFLRRIIAPVGGQGGVTMSYLCPHCNGFPREEYVWWVSAGKNHWWCAVCGEKYDSRQPNRLLVVQTGESFEQAKVFKAHAVPQGLCANLIIALNLLANQHGGKIVTIIGKESRKGLTDGLLEFIRVDNERALDVGAPRRGTGTF